MTRRLFAFVLCVAAGAPLVAQSADPVQELLDTASADCAAFENGTFDAGAAVQEVDLDGEAPMDIIVDSAKFTCSSMASAYCGSGGCTLWTVVAGQTTQYQALGWQRITWEEEPILLIARDGGWCGGAGSQLCYEAVNWSAGERLTLMPAN
ncbi:MAG: hypothetical protein AAGB05_02420 [Pseudomonadota bacterium]